MAANGQGNDSKVNIYSASKNLLEASMFLDPINSDLSNDLLDLSDSLLKSIEQKDPEVDKYIEMIADEEWKLEQFEKDTLDIVNDHRGFFNFELVATDACNLQCTYCFEREYDKNIKTMNDKLDLIISRIDMMLADPWMQQEFGGINIDFWGGEPTLNHKMIRKICSYYKDNPKVKFHIFTNAYDISKVKDIFIEMNKEGSSNDTLPKFTVQVSYDGNPVHDMTRIKNGQGTSYEVLNNFVELFKEGVPVTFKSTITPENFKYLPQVWDHFSEVYEMLIGINPNSNGRPINYAPTIDYYNFYDELELKELESSLIEIAKKELRFHKKYNRFLTTWFDKNRTFCLAGKTMTTVDIDGQMYYCHGCLYKTGDEDKKCELAFGSVFDDDFIEKLRYNYEEKFLSKHEVEIEECQECDSIFCIRCNTLVYGRSQKETFKDKWYDFSNQPHLCQYFKLISKIILATRNIIGGM